MMVTRDPQDDQEIDVEESPAERKKAVAARHKSNPEPLWESYLNQPFVKGTLTGIVATLVIASLFLYVQHEKDEVELLRVRVASAKKNRPVDELATDCAAQVSSERHKYNDMHTDLQSTIEVLQLDLAKANHTRDKALAKCRLCESSQAAVDKALAVVEEDNAREKADLELLVQQLKKENTQLKLQAEDIKMDIQSQVDEAVKRASAQAIRDAENKRRELDLELHDENLAMVTKAEKASRMHAMAERDRDSAIEELQQINEEKQSLLLELGNIKAGHSADFSKLTSELEAISNAVAECQQTLNKQDSTLCTMCNHCSSTHFPACKKCN
mmetsp:Transcript_2682/g.3052  ORF Transcript_2682/g.3052 Transcript_2682/m.3052 type:complete len:328 (+) Transcript_2682:300-1283(+)